MVNDGVTVDVGIMVDGIAVDGCGCVVDEVVLWLI